MTDYLTRAETLIKQHEGFRATPYKCTADKLTVGYGTNLDVGITEKQAAGLMREEMSGIVAVLGRDDWWTALDDNRKAAIIDMAYQLGIHGLYQFKRMVQALSIQDYKRAATEALDSLWATQTPTRARIIANIIKTGEVE